MRRIPFVLPLPLRRSCSTTYSTAAQSYCANPAATQTVESVAVSLNELSLKTPVTDDTRQLGKRAVSTLGNMLKDRTAMDAQCQGSTAVALMRGLSVFDPAGTYQTLFQHVEGNAWRGVDWTGADLAEIARVSPIIDSTTTAAVLLSLIWPCVRALPSMSAEEVGHVARAYATYGVQHPELEAAVTKRAVELAPDMSVHELSRILSALSNVNTAPLIAALCPKIEADITSMAAGTVARCCSILVGAADVPSNIPEMLEKRAGEVVSTGSMGDVVELISNLARLRPTASFTAVFQEHLAPQLLKFKEQYDPEDIVAVLEACQKHNVLNEDVFAAMAERGCRVVQQFDMEGLARVLHILASFELYDPELFPLVASRIQHMTRQKVILDPNHVATVLAAFARLSEKNDNMLYSASAQFKASMSSMTAESATKAMTAFRRLGFNHRDIVGALEQHASTKTFNAKA
eukprot:PhM_4_TR9055/c0_g1_i1/m.60010